MPSRNSRFLDHYESDLLRMAQPEFDSQSKHIHRPSDSSSHHRNSATSAPTSTFTTRSSIASQACINDDGQSPLDSHHPPPPPPFPATPSGRRQRMSRMFDETRDLASKTKFTTSSSIETVTNHHHHHHRPTGYRQQAPYQHHQQRSQNRHQPAPPYRTDLVTPTDSIQEWAHQVHVQQQRKYDWCGSCHPSRAAGHITLDVPSERTVRRVRIMEPTHCYE